jgi:hypothetical protein
VLTLIDARKNWKSKSVEKARNGDQGRGRQSTPQETLRSVVDNTAHSTPEEPVQHEIRRMDTEELVGVGSN